MKELIQDMTSNIKWILAIIVVCLTAVSAFAHESGMDFSGEFARNAAQVYPRITEVSGTLICRYLEVSLKQSCEVRESGSDQVYKLNPDQTITQLYEAGKRQLVFKLKITSTEKAEVLAATEI